MSKRAPGLPQQAAAGVRSSSGKPGKKGARKRRGWKFYALLGIGLPLIVLSFVTGYYYVTFSRMIDARLHGAMQRADPRVFARPFEVHRGQAISAQQLVDRLNDLGYANRARAEQPGEFTVGREALVIVPRDGDHRGQLLRIVFAPSRGKTLDPTGIDHIEAVAKKEKFHRLTLDAPLITALVTSGREKRRDVPLAAIPPHMIKAVLAIEDRRFFDHAGIDPIGIVSAVWEYVWGGRARMRGASTLTQQLIKNTFLTPDRAPTRKFKEWLMSIALERRLTKDQVLEMYMNDVYLGQRGSFAIRGVPEAARLFFGKDISNVSLTEAA